MRMCDTSYFPYALLIHKLQSIPHSFVTNDKMLIILDWFSSPSIAFHPITDLEQKKSRKTKISIRFNKSSRKHTQQHILRFLGRFPSRQT